MWGDDELSLRFSSSLDMNCEVNFVCCYANSPISGSFNPVLLRRCFVVGPRHTWMYPLRFILQQDEYSTITRHTSLFLVLYCLLCLWWPRRFIFHLRLQAYHVWMTFFKVFSLLSSSRHLHRLSINITARDLLGLWCSLIISLH